MNINKAKGLVISERVLSYLEDVFRIELFDGDVDVTVFNNCREVGYVYRVTAENLKSFSWCTYEHRNSDQIILNGAEVFYTGDGLPYKSDSKYDYIADFDADDEVGCAKALAGCIIKFVKVNQNK